MTNTTQPGPTLIREAGISYFPVALVARLPFAMMIVGVLTLVVSARDSLALGGINSAAVGLGTALLGPLIGAAADRFGQRRVLLAAAIANSMALGLMAWIAFSPLPDWAVLVSAFLIGATAPQISPMSRSRLVTIIRTKLPLGRRDRVLNSTMAYESSADEVVFVFGPFIVGLLATTLTPWAPVAAAAVLTLIFVIAFALHPSSVPPQTTAERARDLAPVRDLFRAPLMVTVGGIFGVGLFFGAMLTSLTAFMDERGATGQAGLLYGIMGLGSAVLALSVSLFPSAFSLRARWVTFGLILLAGTLLFLRADTVAEITVALLIAGLGIGPTLVTQYSIAANRSPGGRSATVMTMLGSAIVVGQSLSSAVTGLIAESFGSSTAFLIPAVAGGIVVVFSFANWVISSHSLERVR